MELIKIKGNIQVTIRHNGNIEIFPINNTILDYAKRTYIEYLVNEYKSPVYITNMLFGDGGHNQTVHPNQKNLFGITRINKKVVGQIDPEMPNQAIFSATLNSEEGNDYPITEMALQTNTGELFSMATFPNLNKTNQMELDWNWFVTYV